MTVRARVEETMQRLVQARKDAGLTQTQAAKQVGLTTASSLSSYEIGASCPNLTMFLKMCAVYDVSPVWALTGINPNFDARAWYEKMKTARADINEDLLKIAALLESIEYPAKEDSK